MNARQKSIRQRLKDDFPHYAARCLKIRTKAGAIAPLILNRAQAYAHARFEAQLKLTGRVRAIVLKGRQQGFSTYVSGRFFHRVTHARGFYAYILSHEAESTKNLFHMAQRYYENCPRQVRPHAGKSNAQELVFDKLDSGYRLGTARTKAAGRSQTIQLFHGSEVAFWPNAAQHVAGVLQALPDEPGTEAVFESTANGMGNYFHKAWQLAEAGEEDGEMGGGLFEPIFVPWFWQLEYARAVPECFAPTPEEMELVELHGLTKEQLAWRRAKILEFSGDESLFKQEYPSTATEAFQVSGDSLIPPAAVLRARKFSVVDPVGPVVCGVDPAHLGGDRTAIIFRQGRKGFGLKTHNKLDAMQVAGVCRKILESESPYVDRMFVDYGYMPGVVDRLREMDFGRRVTPVLFGATAVMDKKHYKNRRAEMWGEMRNWMTDPTEQVEIPDHDALQSDIVAPSYHYNSSGQLVLESKEDMKARGIRSPDCADALALTFAAPVRKIGHMQTHADSASNPLGGRQRRAA